MDLQLHLTNVLKSLIQNVGANKGLFVVSDDKGKLIIEAHVTGTEVVKQNAKIEEDATIPLSIIQHVLKTQACTILEDACQSGQFTLDPYVAKNNSKSVLCVPVLGQHKLVAVLYLENNSPDFFTKEKVEMVEMFCSQVAFSFEYDNLFKDLQTRNRILEAKNKSLIELDQVKDQFLSNTSHELRTPLNGIIGIAESMIGGATGTLAQSTCNSLTMIVNCGKRMANLVNDIMDISALKAGKLTIRFKSTDLSKTVNEVVSLSEHLVGKKEIKIINEVESLPILNVDEARIQQVLQNIIGNAVKFTQTGKIVVSSETSNDWVRLSVSDSGVGIPEEAYSQIFEDYKQLDTSDEGTGLGLAIAKRIIELHGGTITVKSQLNVGSQFTITFPMKLRSSVSSLSSNYSHSPSPSPSLSSSTSSTSSSASSSTSSSSTSNSSQPGEVKAEPENKAGHKFYQEGSKATTILSVDDDPTNQAVIHKLLSPYFGIIQAMSGSEALDILHNSPTPPDFILLDVMMPKMSGLEVCERVREKYPACDLPIIMVSAKNKPENIVEGLSKGANDYIGKPINKHELLARIRAQLMICHTCKLASKKPVDSNTPNDDVFICESCRSSLANKSLTGTFTYGPRLSSQELLLSLLHDPANCTEILNYVPMMVTLYDTEGKVVLRNVEARKMVEKLIGAESVNQTFVPHVKDRALAEKILADVIRGTRVEKHIELPLEVSNNSSTVSTDNNTTNSITRDKSVHSLTASLLSLSNSSKGIQGVFVLVAEEDVSQTATLLKDVTRLRTINDQKDDLMSDLAHNLKSPFNGIVGLLEAIQDKINSIIASSATEKQNKNKENAAISVMIDLLSTSALRFSRTIDQISDFSELKEENPEAGIVRNSNVSFKEAFEEAHGLFLPLLNLKKINLSFEFPPSLPVLQTRHRKLVLLLGYLVETAIQYSESLKIHVTAEEKTIENNGKSNNFILLQFTDSQSLLTTKEIAGLFDPSLGVMKGFISPLLAVAVVRGLGGDVTATTDAEKGGIVISAHIPVISSLSPIVHPCPTSLSSIPPPASFTSKFSTLTVATPVPLSPSYESQPAHSAVTSLAQKTPTPPASPRPTTPRRPLILSVDDDSIHQVVISNILVQGGFEVVQAGDGQDALDYLSDPNKQFPDLVLLDNMMPRMNGPETCKRIREKFADKYLPILMFSAKNEAGFVTASIQLGCNDVLPKPFAKTELLTKINAFIKVPPIKSTTPRASLRHEKEIESLTRDRNNLREKVKLLEAAAQKKETELQQLNSQMTDLRSSHEKETEQLENTRKENENIKLQMEEISKEKMQLDSVVTELRNQVAHLQSQYQQTSQQLQQLQQQQLQQQFLQQRGPTPSPSLSPFRPNMSSSSLSPLSPAFPPLSASFNSPALSPFRAGYIPSPSLRSSAFNPSFTPPNNHNPLSSSIHQNSSPHSTSSTPSTPSLNSSSPFSNIHNSTASATPFASPHHSSTIPLNLNNNNNHDNERGYLSSDLFAPRSNTELQEEVKQLKAKLTIAETMFNLQKIRIKFRLFQARFYHNVLLPHQQIAVLKEEIAKRLSLTDSTQIAYLVKNGDTMVEFDEDIEDGLVLDIFLREM